MSAAPDVEIEVPAPLADKHSPIRTKPLTPFLSPLPVSGALDRARKLLMTDANEEEADDFPLTDLGPLAPVAQAISIGTQVQPTMAAHAVLGAAALLTQRVANVRSLTGGTAPLSLYLLTVAESGDGKDSADRPALSAIHTWQKERGQVYEMRLKDYQRNKSDGALDPPKPPYLIAGDITIEGQHRAFREGESAQGVFSTEAGQVLAGHAMSSEQRIKTAANLCGMFDRGNISVARGGNGRLERYGVRLSAHLMIQPAACGDILTDEGLSGIGFWPRFLLGWPPSLPPRKFKPWRADKDPLVGAYWQRCRELLDMDHIENCDQLPVVELDSEAMQWLGQFFEGLEHKARRGGLRDIKPYALRATELACRIAGVLSAWESQYCISLERAQSAARVVLHSIETWQKALNGKADPTPGWALTLYRWLVDKRTPVKTREMTKSAPSSVRPAARRNAALALLKDQGLIIEIDGEVLAQGVSYGSD